MNPISKAIAALLAAGTTSFAGWIATVHTDHLLDPGIASIRYSTNKDEGTETFDGALKQLARDGKLHRLGWIAVHPLLYHTGFQKELFATLERRAPKALHEALQSAGNMHNPKILQLDGPFMEAVLETGAVKQMSRELAAHGLKVSGASGEKFMLLKETGQPRFFCGLVLGIERTPVQRTNSKRDLPPTRKSAQPTAARR